jgi:2-polyprenyl-3-methyl-5-hydroxy-6-metoxy-1,4-benzoquinol methylase
VVSYANLEAGYSAERTRVLLSWIGSGRDVLDLGCYDGRDSAAIAGNGNRVTGVEIIPEAGEASRGRGLRVESFDLSAATWPLELAAYDVVVAGEIIEHMVDPDGFLDNVRRHLRPHGRLIITTPNVASLGRRLMLLVGKNPYLEFSTLDRVNGFQTVGHLRYYTKKTLLRICRAHGFRPLRLTSDRLNLGPISSIRLARLMPSLSFRFIALFELLDRPDESGGGP